MRETDEYPLFGCLLMLLEPHRTTTGPIGQAVLQMYRLQGRDLLYVICNLLHPGTDLQDFVSILIPGSKHCQKIAWKHPEHPHKTICEIMDTLHIAWKDLFPMHDTNSDNEKMLTSRYFAAKGVHLDPLTRCWQRLCKVDLELTFDQMAKLGLSLPEDEKLTVGDNGMVMLHGKDDQIHRLLLEEDFRLKGTRFEHLLQNIVDEEKADFAMKFNEAEMQIRAFVDHVRPAMSEIRDGGKMEESPYMRMSEGWVRREA